MRTMFSIGKALSLGEERCSAEPFDAYTSLVSCVVQWKANIFCFSHSFIFLFREYHSQFPCCVYIFSRPFEPPHTAESQKRGKGGEARKENSQAGKKEKVFQLSTLFRSYFCVFFVFPFIPFQSFANISLTWNNLNICCSSRHIIHSLSFTRSFSFPPRIFQ
jgi:hypothetical protein